MPWTYVGVAAAVIGAATSAVGAIRQGQAAAVASKFNSELADRNALVATQQANADAEAQSRRARMIVGQAQANYGASGVTLEGSPLDILEQSATNAEMDRQNLLYRGKLRAMGYTDEAGLDVRQGKTAIEQSYYASGSAVLTGAGKAAVIGAKGKTDPLAFDQG